MGDNQLVSWLILGSPLIFAFLVFTGPVAGLVIFGILSMYAGAVLLVFEPLFGIVISAGLFVASRFAPEPRKP